jgi:hypothetical protein
MTEVPVIYQDFASEAEEYQHMTADNEIARWSEFDWQSYYDAKEEIPDLDETLLGIERFENTEWQSDIDAINKIEENLDGIEGKIKITCPMAIKDEVLIYLKAKLLETSFEGVHIE